MLDEAYTVHGLGALGAASEPEMVVDMVASSIVRNLGHGMVDMGLDRMHGGELLEVRMYQDVSLGQLL